MFLAQVVPEILRKNYKGGHNGLPILIRVKKKADIKKKTKELKKSFQMHQVLEIMPVVKLVRTFSLRVKVNQK